MPLTLDHKEDLRLRMANLEKKLAESEEERHKLEKTCNVLIKAFREEEKMHYKALNKKYEKFLEDCTVRRRRNDIILRSLCRIEDRARAVFAKTERLKILKDRYVSQIKLNDLKTNESSYLTWRTFPQKTTTHDEITSNSVEWKTPSISDLMWNYKVKEYSNIRENQFLLNDDPGRGFQDSRGYGISNVNSYKLLSEGMTRQYSSEYEGEGSDRYYERNLLGKVLPAEECRKNLNSLEKVNVKDDDLDSYKLLMNQRSTVSNHGGEFNADVGTYKNARGAEYLDNKREKQESNYILDFKPQFQDLNEASTLSEKGIVRHQESIERLKKTLSMEEENENDQDNKSVTSSGDEQLDQKAVEKDTIERNEKGVGVTEYQTDGKALFKTVKNNFNLEHSLTSSPKISFLKNSENENEKNNSVNKEKENHSEFRRENFDQEENICNDNLPKDVESLPMGLDGVDYQNETYPESYYEQPVHQHNYSSIASDVILEEDETEQEDAGQAEPSGEGNQIGSFKKENMFARDKNHQLGYMPSRWPGDQNSNEPDDSEARQLQENTTGGFYKTNGGHVPNGDLQEGLGKACNDQTSRYSDSENSLEREGQSKEGEIEQSTVPSDEPKSDRRVSDVSEKGVKTHVTQSNLVHLLESDSESFQIEHGDKVSGNEDSDFDFSFH